MKAAGKIGLLTIASPRQPRSVGGAEYKGRMRPKVVALPFALLSVHAGRDTDGTLAVRKKLSP
jgi:hypothetical protein